MNDAPHPATSDDTVTLDPENPWLGLDSYTEATRAFFHGRDEEAAELARRVRHKLLTVLFGQSGLGKTSLLRAGLVPRLRKEGYCPVYVRIDYAAGSPVPSLQIRQAIFRVTLDAGHWTRPGASNEGDSLWELLHHRGDLLRDVDGHSLTPLLIFDQFEEIFTLGQADDTGKQRAHQFLEDLADLVENRAPAELEARMEEDDDAAEDFDFARADYRVLIALREDYLAHLESIKDSMPSITQNRMRLARMSGTQALSAVVKPGGKLVTPEVAEAIVRFVAGGAELRNAEIEPALLSLVCRELNTIRQTQKRKEISTDLLAGSRATILSEFYERSLADQPEGVRRVIEDELLTESGYRESLAEERVAKALTEAGAAADTLATLVNRRLLRIEDRLDMRRVELTHDVLCSVVLASRNTRREREARADAERQLVEQREREAAVHRTLRRTRMAVGVCIVLLCIAIAGGVFGYFSTRRAQVAEAHATAARSNAEALVGKLMNKFYAEVAPTGQTATLGSLAKMAVHYYDTLPPSELTAQTQFNRGMALIRLGQAQTAATDFKPGMQHLKAAQALFEKLRTAGGPQRDAATYGLALSLFYQSYAVSEYGAPGAGNGKRLERTAALLKPLVEGPHPSRRVRYAYANALGLLAIDFRSPREAVTSSETARKLLQGLGALDLSDLDATTLYIDDGDSEARMLLALGQARQAREIEAQGYALAGNVLARQPGNLHAMDDRFLTANVLGVAAVRRHDLATAAKDAAAAQAAAAAWVNFDPRNAQAWVNGWLPAFSQVAAVQYARGDIHGAIATLKTEMALVHDPRAPSNLWEAVVGDRKNLAILQAETGDAADAARSRAILARDQHKANQQKLGGSLATRLRAAAPAQQHLNSRLHLVAGTPTQALTVTAAAIKRMRAIAVPASDTANTINKTVALQERLATASLAALRARNYRQAEAFARERLALLRAWPTALASAPAAGSLTLGGGESIYPPTVIPRAEATLANALAMQGKQAAAVKALAPALAYYAAQQKAGATDTTFRHDYAYALYVSAIAQPADGPGPKQRRAALAAAAELLAGASQQARQLSSFRYVSGLIAKARTHAKR